MLEAGVLETLLPGVHRLVAPNPSVLTGPGTNTYLLGDKRITVLDPGPDMPEHIAARLLTTVIKISVLRPPVQSVTMSVLMSTAVC